MDFEDSLLDAFAVVGRLGWDHEVPACPHFTELRRVVVRPDRNPDRPG